MKWGDHFFILGETIPGNRPTIRPIRRPAAEHLVNEDIRFPRVFVLDEKGQKLGVMTRRDALERARSVGLDLVIISDNPQQPVAKILDYGRFKYDRKKKRKEAKVHQVVIENREIRLTPMIGDHDLMVKSRKAREFLVKGDRVKVSLKFRGREMARQDLGHAKLGEFFNSLADIAKIEKEAVLTGKFLDMYLVRDKQKSARAEKSGAEAEVKETTHAENENQKRAHEANPR